MVKKVRMPRKGKEKDQGETSRDGFVGGPRFGVLGNQIDEERASINDNDKAITRNIGGIVIISKVVDGGRPTLAGRDPKIGHTKKESQRGLDQGHPYARGRNKDNMSGCSIRRGGICVARRMDKVNVIIHLKHLHFIHLRVRFENQDWWWFSLVYASPIEGVRGELRNYLHNISTSNPDRWWMMADDFNDILIQEEKKGGAPTSVRKCFIFHQRINVGKELYVQLDEVLYQEELAWFQRSKAKWLHDRDKITRYCHLKTSRRRRKKAIHMLRNDDGVWIEDEHKVHKLLRNELVSLSRFKEASSLGNYLGVPLLGKSPRRVDFNHLVDKLCWAIRNGNNSLWIEVLKGKYTKRWSVNMNLEAKTYDSPLWKVIVKFWLAIENKQWWMVGNETPSELVEHQSSVSVGAHVELHPLVKGAVIVAYQATEVLAGAEDLSHLADWIRWNLELTSYEVQGISWPELWENSLTPGRVWRSNSGPEWVSHWLKLGIVVRFNYRWILMLWFKVFYLVAEGMLEVGVSSKRLEIRRLLDQTWQVEIIHVYREANCCADRLANLACGLQSPLVLYEQAPPCLSSLLLFDVRGVSLPRFIPL
ncbi:hypothetical protein D0Y65_018656 [Glycine soja]|uniref:RNase H type-1 domain-containing protein n=1 Tax=Glycine soja TaxID=3848 RepID=A0A445K054_GLYSO|nr:hypothetical protein D0Y65_018656 [Glycine soja]